MPIFDARDLLSFPGGDNSTDTIIGGIHFNATALDHWNFTYYPSNGTLSNSSRCLLTFDPYTPKFVFANGSFINSTSCYSPIKSIGVRGGVGMGFTVAFGLCLLAVLMNLRKHGRMFLPASRRFWPIGRRWQWYWAIFVCAMGLISLITNVDVDRYYLPEIPIVLHSFFWYLVEIGTMAIVWEAVRHWGSWMERQYIDPDPFILGQDDKRAMFEFWLPLFFYFWLWLNFFLIVPRSWGPIELQRSAEQTAARAVPSATDARFKAAAFCLFICWLTILVSLRHSIKHYRERNRGVINRAVGLIRYTPVRFMLIVPLSLAMVAYQALCSWQFQYSVLNVKGNNAAIFAGGFAPSVLIIIVQIISGWLTPNEDRELIRQRRLRGIEQDRDLGIVHKPAWWRRVNGENNGNESMRDRIARNVREIGGGRATARNIDRMADTRARESEANSGAPIEMGAMRRLDSNASSVPAYDAARPPLNPYSGRSDRRRSERTMEVAAGLLFPNAATNASADRRAYLMGEGPAPPPPYVDRGRPPTAERPSTTERSNSTGTTNSVSGPPQQVRSMLDI